MATLQRGRKAISQPIEIGEIRVLSRSDLAVLAEPRPPNSLQTLRDNHHRVARAIASGMKDADVADTCGLSITRVSQLKADPSIKELVAHYRSLLTEEWVRESDPVINFMRSNALKAQAMLSDKLDDFAERNEFLPTRDLVLIAEFGSDRTGYGKVNKNVNINVDFAAQLEAARNRSAGAQAIRSREVGALLPGPQPASDDVPPRPVRRMPSSPFRRL